MHARAHVTGINQHRSLFEQVPVLLQHHVKSHIEQGMTGADERCLRLALESLKSAMAMLDHPTISDREWFKQGADEIFEPYLPPEPEGGQS